MSYIIFSYSVYLVITIALTIWVAHKLFQNGKIFLVDIFHGNEPLATSVNNLLLTGFYLINIGYAVYMLQIPEAVLNWQSVFERLGTKIGLIILILGGMHFFNLYIFFKLRNKAKHQRPSPLPATPQGIF